MSSKPIKKGFAPKPNLDDFISGSNTDSMDKTNTPAISTEKPATESPPAAVEAKPEQEKPVKADKPAVKVKTKASDKDEAEAEAGTHKHIFSLNDADHKAFRMYAFEKDVTKTSIMRAALKDYMKRNP